MTVSGPAAQALAALTQAQLSFIKSLPKAELHAHLNGCIPIATLQQLAQTYTSDPASDLVRSGIQKLNEGVELNEIHDFFDLFPSIYALTATREGLKTATSAVIESFLGKVAPEGSLDPGEDRQCDYLELRSTPKQTPTMTREHYVRTVLDEVARYPKDTIGVIVSMDRKMSDKEMKECVDAAITLKREGHPVVGIDLCGDPLARDVADFERFLKDAKAAKLGVTLHIAETTKNTTEESSKFLSYGPDRLGHATFLNEAQINQVINSEICVEICLSSNILCKTATSLDAHHIRHYLERDHPIAICTDDTLPFRTNLTAEYALLLAPRPYGLGLSEDEVKKIAEMSMASRFTR